MQKTKYSRECVERLSRSLDGVGRLRSGPGCNFLESDPGPERSLIVAVREIAGSPDWSKTIFSFGCVDIELHHGATKVSFKQKDLMESYDQGRLQEFLETEVAIAKISK